MRDRPTTRAALAGFSTLVVLTVAAPAARAGSDISSVTVTEFPGSVTDLRGSEVAHGPFQVTELAGNPLATYPHFEYVRAFNEGSAVTFALDPTRFPGSAGATVDLYIVEPRSAAEWQLDGSLTDVRGAPQTETLGTSTIQSSTFVLTGSELLSGDAGTGLGVPYDLVCDVNQNGVLDGGDLLDGFGDIAGFYVVHDVTQPGPLAVTETTYTALAGTVTPGFEAQNIFYPSDVAMMGRLPLVIVSHGNGHQYVWYDHIGQHLASYGYIVMSHRNNTVPGVQTAATTTLEHTDAFLGQLALIEGGLLLNHVDKTRMTWIGHSRGGEGITIAYDRIVDGTYVPQNFELEDIILLSSIAPVDFLGPASSDPHGAVFSLWTGGADSDVNGCAGFDIAQTFHLHDRAQRWRQSISLHGVGHGDFHNGNANPFATGPCLVGRSTTHVLMRGYLLPLVKHYIENNAPARDFLWRQWEQFRPIGGPTSSCVVVDLMFREDPGETFVIDDFQTLTATDVSSSGGAVTFTVSGVNERRLDDSNGNFSNIASDVMNGMTVGGPNDTTRGVVFQWSADAFYEQEIVPEARDLTDDVYLSFRACQSTRHPNTTADLGDLTFDVTLVDGSGATSTINIGAYGGGLEEPYGRSGCGSGIGWHNEFETIRMRLEDFTNNGSGLDLSDVAAVRLEFGPSHGSGVGRIGLDELTISADPPQPFSGNITIDPDPLPIIPPGDTTLLKVFINVTGETLLPGTATLHYRFDDGAFLTEALSPVGDSGLFLALLPAPACGDVPEAYYSVVGTISGLVTFPADAPATVDSTVVGELQPSFTDDFETDLGWTTLAIGASTGAWERGVPVDDPAWPHDPASDADGSGSCFLTQNELGDTDVDGGLVRLTSPPLDLTGAAVRVSYDYYLKLSTPEGSDRMLVEYNGDGSPFWQTLAVHDTDGGLAWRSFQITGEDIAAVGGVLSATARIRFVVNDSAPDGIVEAGVDGFLIETLGCE